MSDAVLVDPFIDDRAIVSGARFTWRGRSDEGGQQRREKHEAGAHARDSSGPPTPRQGNAGRECGPRVACPSRQTPGFGLAAQRSLRRASSAQAEMHMRSPPNACGDHRRRDNSGLATAALKSSGTGGFCPPKAGASPWRHRSA